eukprot:1495846-Pyramimonas_sp.AAC.1
MCAIVIAPDATKGGAWTRGPAAAAAKGRQAQPRIDGREAIGHRGPEAVRGLKATRGGPGPTRGRRASVGMDRSHQAWTRGGPKAIRGGPGRTVQRPPGATIDGH